MTHGGGGGGGGVIYNEALKIKQIIEFMVYVCW